MILASSVWADEQVTRPLAVAPLPAHVDTFGWSASPASFVAGTQPQSVMLEKPWTGAFTLAGWIRLERKIPGSRYTEVTPATIAMAIEQGSGELAAQFGISDGRLFLVVRRGSKWSNLRGGTDLPLHQWIHVAAQRDAEGGMALFLNGREDGRKSGGGANITIDKMVIGAWGRRVLEGQIATMEFFPGPVAASGIAQLAQANSSQATAALLRNGLPVAGRTPTGEASADYGNRQLQVMPTATLPLAAGLLACASVLPSRPGELPGIMTQSVGFGAARICYPNAFRPERAGEKDFPFGTGIRLPFMTLYGQPLRAKFFRYEMNGMPGLITVAKNPISGVTELYFLRQSAKDPLIFDQAETLPCGPKGVAFGQAYPAWLAFFGDVDLDGVPDLLLMSSESNDSYYPDAPKNFWTGEELPNSGPGKGYTINDVWLGQAPLQVFHWAKGSMGADGKPRFGPMRTIIQGDKDYPLRWKGFHGATAAALSIAGKPHLILAGDLDRFLAVPIQVRAGVLHCGLAANLFPENKRLVQNYIVNSLNVADMDGDGIDDIVVSGNPGSVVVISGTKVGAFRERPASTIGGPLAMQTLIVPSRLDWDADGWPDIIAGDASGWLMFWPGTKDPRTYGAPEYFKVNGQPVHIQAGYRGSIQGPREARWGYLNPTACDWDGDGQPEIVSCDINADLLLWRRTANALELQPPERFTLGGEPLPVAWRQHPAFIPGEDGLAGDDRPCLLLQGYDGDLALAVPKAKGSSEIERMEKFKYEDGGNILTCGPTGCWGRSKFLWVDWDEDGAKDVIYSTNPASNTFITREEIGRRPVPLFLKNVGTTQKPIFARPQGIKLKDQYLGISGHIAAPWLIDGEGIARNSLILGAEDGRIYFFDRSELIP